MDYNLTFSAEELRMIKNTIQIWRAACRYKPVEHIKLVRSISSKIDDEFKLRGEKNG